VDRVDHQFFARARLACHEHRIIGPGNYIDLATKIFHMGAVSHNLLSLTTPDVLHQIVGNQSLSLRVVLERFNQFGGVHLCCSQCRYGF